MLPLAGMRAARSRHEGVGRLWATHLEVSLAPAIKARFFVEAQGALAFGARCQRDLVAVCLPGQVKRVSKNPSSKSQPAVVGVRYHILDHRV